MLADLSWQPSSFEAICHPRTSYGDAVIEFPSPFAPFGTGSPSATMSWHAARDRQGNRIQGPAVIVLDIIQAGNFVSGFIARALARHGIHGFVLDLPHSPKRGTHTKDCATLYHGMRQAVADARRARDVVASLPMVDGRVGIQGTSFGGFVASLAGALDNAFDINFLALCGGDMQRILTQGRGEASKIRQKFAAAGMCDSQSVADLLWQVEPLRLAHRLEPKRTWLWTARRDQVVPADCSRALADAAALPSDHRLQLSGCHYTCALAAPWWVGHLVNTIRNAWSLGSEVQPHRQPRFVA